MFVIAEVGCNHMGDMKIAEEMISVAATYCKVDAVKFQKRNVKSCLTPTQYYEPHPVPENSFGKTYGEHREALEFTVEQHRELKSLCHKHGVAYACSVWDHVSLMDMIEIEADIIKIPSAKNNNWGLLNLAISLVNQPLHISLGMTTREEEDQILRSLRNRERMTVVYACTAGYPVAFEDVCLGEITRLRKKFDMPIGYSGHHLGIAVDIAAMVLGANFIERHFTLDRSWKGTDHAASLEPDGMRKLVRDLEHVEQALGYKPRNGFLECEAEQRGKLKC